MKRILCALLACAICTSVAIGFSGCGCSDNNGGVQTPGYVVEATEPDLKDGDFGYFVVNSNELMLTSYTGKDKDIKIPETYNNYKVTIIGKSVFNGSDITSVEMPDSITTVQDYAFSSCNGLTSVKFSKNIKTFGNSVFFNCPNLKEVDIPASVKDLGSRTFSATGITSVTIPKSDNLTSIGEFVFYQCQQLKEVTIPSNITSIKESAFSDCPNKITIKAAKGSYSENYAKVNGFNFEEIKQ